MYMRVWKCYLGYAMANARAILSAVFGSNVTDNQVTQTIISLYERAISEPGLHVVAGGELWNLYIAYLSELLDVTAEDNRPEVLQRLRDVYLKRFATPLIDNDAVMEQYKAWEDEQDDDVDLEHAEDVLEGSMKHLEDICDDEAAVKLATDAIDQQTAAGALQPQTVQHAVHAWLAYIKREKKHHDRVYILYERAIKSCYSDTALWEHYVLWTSSHNTPKLGSVLDRGVRNCSWSGFLWEMKLRLMAANNEDFSKLLSTIHKAIQSVAPGGPVAVADVCNTGVECIQRSGANMSVIRDIFQKSKDKLDDINPQLPVYPLQMLTYWMYLEHTGTAGADDRVGYQMAEHIIQLYGEHADAWAEVVQCAMQNINAESIKRIRELYERAVVVVNNWGIESIQRRWMQFERMHGTVDTVLAAVARLRKRLAPVEQEIIEKPVREKPARERQQKALKLRQEQAANKADKAPRGDKPVKEKKEKKEKTSKTPKAPKPPKTEPAEQSAPDQSASAAPVVEHKTDDVMSSPPDNKKQRLEAKPSEYDAETEKRMIVLKRVPDLVSEQEIRDALSGIGNVVAIHPTQHRGTYFAEMEKQEQAIAAPSSSGVIVLKNTPISVERYGMKSQRGKPGETEEATVFVSNLSFDVTDKDLYDAFGGWGELVDVRLLRDATGRSRGVAYIEYHNNTEATRAVLGSDKMDLHGRRITSAISRPPGKKAPGVREVKLQGRERHKTLDMHTTAAAPAVPTPAVPTAAPAEPSKPMNNADFAALFRKH